MSPILTGVIASGISGNLSTNSFESIATVTVGVGGQSTISFTSIPSTYKHLQIRGILRSTGNDVSVNLRLNSDTGTNYIFHYLQGDGSSVAAGYSGSNVSPVWIGRPAPSATTTGTFGYMVMDILDYKNTNKYKTIKSMTGYDANGTGYTVELSQLWRNTNAITQIDIYNPASNLAQYSSLALYGVK